MLLCAVNTTIVKEHTGIIAMSVSVLAKNTCQTTGEGPYWEESSSSLLYVDISQCDVHRWNSTTGEDTNIHLGW